MSIFNWFKTPEVGECNACHIEQGKLVGVYGHSSYPRYECSNCAIISLANKVRKKKLDKEWYAEQLKVALKYLEELNKVLER